jgi:hypothetical protein
LSAADTRQLIAQAVERLQEEVPAIKQLKLVARLELRARGGDAPVWRVEVPGPKISKDVRGDEKVRLSVPRSHFNELAKDGRLQHWRDAYLNGYVRVVGQDDILKLIGRVIERHETRAKIKKRRL